jgi:topoisomerase IA-like protein
LYELPWTIPNTQREVAMGKFGLYIKEGKNNIRLPQQLWQKAFDRKLTSEDVKVYEKK